MTHLALTMSLLLSASQDSPHRAGPLLSPIFGDNMVLQRGKTNTFWGWAEPGEKIEISIAGHSATATADRGGSWRATITPPAPGGPYTVTVRGNESIRLSNVMVGDVWICGGQSNMGLGLGMTRDGAQESSRANHPDIRLFKVQPRAAYSPVATPAGTWKVCSPTSVSEGGDGGFSAVAYYYALKLQSELHVPIGLVQDCLGGTPAECWMSETTLRGLKDFRAPLDEIDRLRKLGGNEYGNYIMHWYDEYDRGIQGQRWDDPALDDSVWAKVNLPGGFAELGVPDVPSVCWFRKEITLPDPLPTGHATLYLGSVEKMDTTTINGKWAGASSWVENPRVYAIAPGVLKPGKNLVTIRVMKMRPDGGFLSPAETLRLAVGDLTIPLAGEWRGKLSVDARPPHPLPLGFENYPIMPSVLYDGMLSPVSPLAIRGALWYQGEANFLRAQQYKTLLPAMIRDWRRLFGQGNFPFYIVSLPAFMHHRNEPGEDAWAELREAQAQTAQRIRNCGLAVTVDTGDPDNIHPIDKRVVGERLAALALRKEFGMPVPCSGPTFHRMRKGDTGQLRVEFGNIEGGLVAAGGELKGFAIAGEDRKWHWAEAKIDGANVVLWSPQVPKPEAVRYAWQANPEANLFNTAGFPATPFRTDDWPLSTLGAKPW